MGNAAYRINRPRHALYSNLPKHRHSDYGSHSNSSPTVDAPWNVTQWIDPLDPHPKVTSMPIILVIRK